MPQHSRELGAWREQLWSTYARLESSSDASEFYGAVKTLIPRRNELTIVDSTTQVTRRTPSNIRSDDSEYILCAYQLMGRGFAEQDGRTAETTPGDFVLYDTTRPYRLHFDGPFRQRVFRLPRKHLEPRVRMLRRGMAYRIDGRTGPGALINGMIASLADTGASLPSEALAEIQSAASEFIGAALNVAFSAEDGSSTQFCRLASALEARLGDSEVELKRFASDQGVSLRALQRAFKAQGATPSRWRMERRLERIAEQLRSPVSSRRSITEIALSGGFNDMGHFYRAFLRRYGMNPSRWRSSG